MQVNLWLQVTFLLCLTMVTLCVQHNAPSQSLLSLISAIIGDKPADEVPAVCLIWEYLFSFSFTPEVSRKLVVHMD